jgi:acyl carrier protein
MSIRGESAENECSAGTLTAIERTVAQLWSEVMQMSELPDAGDDFFALGGDSMTMVLVEFRIMEEFGLQLPGGTMLAAPTVRELATVIEEQSRRPDVSGSVQY